MTSNLVLVHGGTVTSQMWDSLLSHLRTPAIAVDLPGRRYRPSDLGKITREDWVQAVCDDIVTHGFTDVVLVGHSSGGYVIPGVATGLSDRVRHLVFVAATVPAEGMRPVDYIKPKLREAALGAQSLLLQGAAGRTLGGLRPGEPPIETHLEIVENEGRMGLEAPGPLLEAFTWTGFPREIPRTFVRCLRDRVVTPELVDQMLANMGGARVVDIDAGHFVADEAPAELAAVLDSIADEDGPKPPSGRGGLS
jgi:pimeloyl-ACP methyl ester carboxylesterase